MSILSRYLEILGSAQLFASERTTYEDDCDAFLSAARGMGIVLMMHGLIGFAALNLLARVLNAPFLDSNAVRGALIVTLFAVFVWLGFNYDYLINLRSRIQAESPDAITKRRRQVVWFTTISYLLGFLAILAEVLSRGWKHSP